MDALDIIAKRRDRQTNSVEELAWLARGAAAGSIPDYQLSAWLMAAYLNPLDAEETANLTAAMADSGERLDLSGLPKPWVDKHSTGGVGDKTTIALLPLLAACGLTVVKMSGRGLGITGGTVDKLQSIPGFRMDLTPAEMKAQAKRIGLAITGQTANLAPADKALYALRDVTGTVGSIPLIVSSILCKKLAGGADTIVLDVKCGSGGFMPDRTRARELALALKGTAERCRLRIQIVISDMDRPLGTSAGNALEVKEAFRTLRGEQSRFSEFCVALAGVTLHACGASESSASGELRARAAIGTGAALEKARQWLEAQAGSAEALDSDAWGNAMIAEEVRHEGPPGWIARVDARKVGEVVVALGGGRATKDAAIDPTAGVEVPLEIGGRIEAGGVLARIHCAEHSLVAQASARLRSAIEVAGSPVEAGPTILEVL